MERIQKALEQATKQRAEVKAGHGVTPQPDPRPAGTKFTDTTVDLTTGIFYSQTKIIEVPEQTLLDNRIIAALPDHQFKDAYRMLRTRVLQTMRANNWNTLAVTGPASGCGKTLTAINLAVSLAMEITNTVLLVDLDLRKPSIHKYFGYQPELGLSDYLTGSATLPDILVSPGIARLVVLPGRESLINSSEMLRSPKMVNLVSELKYRYPERIIIFDLPPILAADDALSFAPYTDAMLMVAENGGTQRDDLQKAIEILRDAPLIGTVLNKAPISTTSGYGYYRNQKAL